MSLFRLVKKSKEVLKHEGFGAFFKKASLRILKSLFNYKSYFQFQRNYMFEQKLNGNDVQISPLAIQDVTLDIIETPEQVDMLISDGYDLNACPFLSNAKEGLSKGAVFFFLFVRKTLAHSSWVSMDNEATLFDPIFKSIKFDGAGYIGLCYTSPLYRGKGFYPYVLSRICKFLTEKGKTRAIISTKKTNHPSIRGITKAGFVLIGEVWYLKLLILEFRKVIRGKKILGVA